MGRQRRLKRRVAHALRGITRGAVGRRSKAVATLRELLALAWPIMLGMAGETVMGLVDTKLVGGLGPDALGGVGVALTVVFLGTMVVYGFMRGVKVCVSHAVGEGRGHLGARYAQAGAALGLAAGVAFCLLARRAGGVFLWVGIAPAMVPYARDFLGAIALWAPATGLMSALVQHRQGMGDSRTPMVANLCGNLLNALLGWALIYGHAGLPALGVRGAAYATAISEWLEALALAGLLLRDSRRAGQWAKIRLELPLRHALREIAALGLPTALQFGSEMLAFTVFTALLGVMGAEQIAAHQIALATVRVSFLPGLAIGEAASVLVGQALGRRSLAEADRAMRAGLVTAMAFMASWAVVFALCGGAIARLFTADATVAHVARTLLWIAAGFQVLDASNMVLRTALRGAKDARVPALIGVAVVWTCVPTAALVLGRWAGLGAAGGWLGFLVETALATALLARRWRRGAWRLGY